MTDIATKPKPDQKATKTTPEHAVVWTEIPVTDLDRSRAFYGSVLQGELKVQVMGPDTTAVFPYAEGQGVSGHLYVGKPAPEGTGATVHLIAPGPLEATMERVTAAGGRIVGEPIQIPFGRFCYALDLDGNSIGVFEA